MSFFTWVRPVLVGYPSVVRKLSSSLGKVSGEPRISIRELGWDCRGFIVNKLSDPAPSAHELGVRGGRWLSDGEASVLERRPRGRSCG